VVPVASGEEKMTSFNPVCKIVSKIILGLIAVVHKVHENENLLKS